MFGDESILIWYTHTHTRMLGRNGIFTHDRATSRALANCTQAESSSLSMQVSSTHPHPSFHSKRSPCSQQLALLCRRLTNFDVAAHIPFMHDAHVLQAYQAGPGYGNYSINLGARPQGTCRAAGSSAGYAALLKNAETSRHHRSHWLRAALYGDCGRRRAPCGLSGRRLTCSRHEGALQSWPEQIRYPQDVCVCVCV